MALQQTPAVVLNIMDHGESDKIVTFYCPVIGKLTGIAKGAKRSKKRFVNKLEIFSWLEIIYDDGGRGSLVRIAEAELIDPFISLREGYEPYVAANLIIELMICWTRENDADEELFPLLIWALNSLNEGLGPLLTVVLFQVRLFSIMGYQPHLSGCLKCGCFDFKSGPYGFSPGRSGLVCAGCRSGSSVGYLPVSLSTAKLLKNAQELPREKISRLRFSVASGREAVNILKHYGQHILQREIHSWAFLEG